MMPSNYDVEMQLDVKVSMRDGVILSADIYLPKGTGPFPTVLMRTPYNNNVDLFIEKGRRLANSGFVCVVQDCRGRFDSEGTYYPFRNEGPDGYDTQQWVGQQPWSNGKIGMAGSSYGGWVQWQSAPYRNEFLTCIAPRVMAADIYSGLIYPGGALQLHVVMNWGMGANARSGQNITYHNWTEAFRTLPLIQRDELAGRNLNFWKDWVQHAAYDEYWHVTNVEAKWGEIATPGLNMGGWYDLYAQHMFINFNGLRLQGRTPQARQSRLIVGPWPHNLSASSRTGDIDFGAHSMVDLEALETRWFNYWLKGIDNGIVDEPPLRLFIMGINQWHDEYEWPLARTQWQKWYLHSGGAANTLLGDGALSPEAPEHEQADGFIYDPRYPAPTIGGNNCCSPLIVPWGPYDQRPLEMRTDVLCYTSAPMAQDMEVTGPIKMVLYAASNAPDTDWTAKLVEVSPTGYAKNLCDGIIRARFRENFTNPSLIEPNRVYRYEIDMAVTGNVFREGHAIRVEISSSNFPRFDRNLNTGGDPATETEMRQARQTIYHTREYPSHIVLPVIPADERRG